MRVCANFSRIRAETDARADVKHQFSFNRPYLLFATLNIAKDCSTYLNWFSRDLTSMYCYAQQLVIN